MDEGMVLMLLDDAAGGPCRIESDRGGGAVSRHRQDRVEQGTLDGAGPQRLGLVPAGVGENYSEPGGWPEGVARQLGRTRHSR